MEEAKIVKTPVTKLQEYLLLHGSTPHYDLVASGMGIHNGTFKYIVSAQGLQANGVGRSKKEAKHLAAKNALAMIALNGGLTGIIEPVEVALQNSTASPDQNTLKEADDGPKLDDLLNTGDRYPDPAERVSGNCVGKLDDLCVTNELPLANYTLAEDVGLAHEKMFTYECQILMHTVKGVAHTKKRAKQLAANAMLLKLQTGSGDLLCTNEECPEDANTVAAAAETVQQKSHIEVIDRYKEIEPQLHTTKRAPLRMKVSQQYNGLKHLDCKPLQELKGKVNRNDNFIYDMTDPRSVLEEIMEELGCEMSFVPMNSTGKNLKILVVLATSPEAVLFGSGLTKNIAMGEACRKALRHLVLMTS